MDALVTGLVQVINREVSTFQRLLDTLEEGAEAWKGGRLLAQTLADQRWLEREAAELEAERKRMVRTLAGEAAKDGAYTRLLAVLQGPHADALRRMRVRLVRLQRKLWAAARRKARLVRAAARVLDGPPAGALPEPEGRPARHLSTPVQPQVEKKTQADEHCWGALIDAHVKAS